MPGTQLCMTSSLMPLPLVFPACVLHVGGPYTWATRTFTAHRNGGAFCNGNPISVSRTKELNKSLLVTGQCVF